MAGTYTDIISITAPSEAAAGEKVNITVNIKNTFSSVISIMVGGALEYGVSPWPQITYPSDWANVNAGATQSFSGYFTMPYYPPGKIITIHAYSYYYDGSGWHFDDELTKDVITVAGPSGSITGKWVNKSPEGNNLSIPASVAADNNTFEVGVKYKNTGGAVTAGCEVKVWDPDGILRASPAIDWAGMSSGEELSKEYNICQVDKAGTWMVRIRFLTSDYEVLDSFEGNLLYAEVELVPTFSDFAISFTKSGVI